MQRKPPPRHTKSHRKAPRTPHVAPVGLPQLLFTVRDAAQALGIGETLLYRLIERGEVDSIKIGRLRRITRDALDAFVARKSAS